MSRKLSLALIGLAFGGISPLLVVAEDKPIPAEKQAKLLQQNPGADANKDGVLTRDEIRAATANAHQGSERNDKAGVGILSVLVPTDPVEILSVQPQADKDGDGKLSATERREFMESQQTVVVSELLAAHTELDTNHDGSLSPDEMRAGRKTIEEYVSQRVMASHPEADRDGNGQLSMDELKAFHATRSAAQGGSPASHVEWAIRSFAQLDRDGNGYLTLDELQAYKQGLSPANDKKHDSDGKKPKEAKADKKAKRNKKAGAEPAQ